MEVPAFFAETPRLRLRQMELSDAAFIHRLLNERSFLQNIGDRGVRSTADAVIYIEDRIRGSYRLLGYGMYLVQRKEDDMPLGTCGLVKREFLQCPDLGFAFLPEHAGQGYAAEAAGSVIAAAGSRWGLVQLYAITKLDNDRSVRLLERLGFQRERSCVTPQGEELELYATVATGAG
jgi:ribosomal-protein-alanine N-acetyltransferase